MMVDHSQLEERLGYRFKDQQLLQTALTHSSYANEHGGHIKYNERLEFLGDAFFDAVVGEAFFRRFPNREEGFLSRIRAVIVCEDSLARKANQIGLGSFLRLSHGEEKTGGRNRTSILADAMEAIIGAIYLDGGFEAVQNVVLTLFQEEIEDASQGKVNTRDYKTRLQEWLQARGITDIRYELIEESGPDHDKTFVMGLIVEGKMLSRGEGKSKKEAQQQAAKITLERESKHAL